MDFDRGARTIVDQVRTGASPNLDYQPAHPSPESR
jgi:hypothetical protein